MTKQELIDKLREQGYKAGIIDGLPYIFNQTYTKAEKIIKDIGYKGSYGIRKEREDDGRTDSDK